uniref:AlNc14C514G12019 protein n=1 Tax=Albugo laibachii Nc14 TaxID=890382 RepID=F0X0S5_9STRA|nr:AlNc14C514G12019 [Albugo laibachii Nc14]|eukprot:CCA27369.1 AlNc14C514G12019 [Albugo laibachii Nc14]
MQQRSKNFGK